MPTPTSCWECCRTSFPQQAHSQAGCAVTWLKQESGPCTCVTWAVFTPAPPHPRLLTVWVGKVRSRCKGHGRGCEVAVSFGFPGCWQSTGDGGAAPGGSLFLLPSGFERLGGVLPLLPLQPHFSPSLGIKSPCQTMSRNALSFNSPSCSFHQCPRNTSHVPGNVLCPGSTEMHDMWPSS